MEKKCKECKHAHKTDEREYFCDAAEFDIECLDCYVPRELNGTIPLMQSEDYKDRFKAEYYQTKIRCDKLHKMLVRYSAGTLDFEPSCPIELLEDQEEYMRCYLASLEIRAEIEKIDL
jgi:hypothetical protein